MGEGAHDYDWKIRAGGDVVQVPINLKWRLTPMAADKSAANKELQLLRISPNW